MKNIFTLFLSIFLASATFGQNIEFSYVVIPGGATSEVMIKATNTGASPENISSFNYGFYFKSAETQVGTLLGQGATTTNMSPSEISDAINASALSSLSWAPDLTGSIQTVSGGLTPPGYDMVFTGAAVDGNAVPFSSGGTDIAAGATIDVITLLFNNEIGGGLAETVFMVETSYISAYKYADFNFTENNIVANDPPNQEQSLPIKLADFIVSKFEMNSSKLDWSTESEINGSHFEIMRSTDTENWEQIGTVQAVGESQITQSYSLIDKNVGMLRNNATYYYQLKMVDLDGSYEMSEVRSLTFNAEGIQVLAYPNPTTDLLYVNMITEKSLGNGLADLIILDNTGKILQKNKISSNGISEIDVSNVPSGLLALRIMYSDKVLTQKIVKIQ